VLTAVGLTPGGSSTVHIYTQTIYRTTQLWLEDFLGFEPRVLQLIGNSARRVPSLRIIPCLTTEEKARRNLSQGNRSVPVGTMKTKYTEKNIHNNKNT